jgi:hypothetical protein
MQRIFYVILAFILFFIPLMLDAKILNLNFQKRTSTTFTQSPTSRKCNIKKSIETFLRQYYGDSIYKNNNRIIKFVKWMRKEKKAIDEYQKIQIVWGKNKEHHRTVDICDLVDSDDNSLNDIYYYKDDKQVKLSTNDRFAIAGFWLGGLFISDAYSQYSTSIRVPSMEFTANPGFDKTATFACGSSSSCLVSESMVGGINIGIHEFTHGLRIILGLDEYKFLSELATYYNQTKYALPVKVRLENNVNKGIYESGSEVGVRDSFYLHDNGYRPDISSLTNEYAAFMLGPFIKGIIKEESVLKLYETDGCTSTILGQAPIKCVLQTKSLEELFRSIYDDDPFVYESIQTVHDSVSANNISEVINTNLDQTRFPNKADIVKDVISNKKDDFYKEYRSLDGIYMATIHVFLENAESDQRHVGISIKGKATGTIEEIIKFAFSDDITEKDKIAEKLVLVLEHLKLKTMVSTGQAYVKSPFLDAAKRNNTMDLLMKDFFKYTVNYSPYREQDIPSGYW